MVCLASVRSVDVEAKCEAGGDVREAQSKTDDTAHVSQHAAECRAVSRCWCVGDGGRQARHAEGDTERDGETGQCACGDVSHLPVGVAKVEARGGASVGARWSVAVGGRGVGGERRVRWFVVAVAVRVDDILDVVPLVYVNITRRGFDLDLEAEVVVASLCEGKAVLELLDDANGEDRRGRWDRRRRRG